MVSFHFSLRNLRPVRAQRCALTFGVTFDHSSARLGVSTGIQLLEESVDSIATFVVRCIGCVFIAP